MLFAAEFGTGQVLWSIIWFSLFFMLIMLVFSTFADIMRSDMSGWSKALWTIAIIFLPFLGILTYLIVNGGDTEEHNRNERGSARTTKGSMDYFMPSAPSSGGSSDELVKLAGLHDGGKLTDDEYAAAKAKILAS
jgi:hypothetical protein